MAILISEASPGFDRWSELRGLLVRNFAYMAPRIDPPSSLAGMTEADLAAKAEAETLLLAYDGNALIGCVFVRIDGDCATLGKLAVDESYRRSGIARRLVAHAETVATRKERSTLRLQTRIELTENHAAFSRLGFAKTEETTHPGFHRPTSITMRKVIGASP